MASTRSEHPGVRPGVGAAAREHRAAALDAWLAGLLPPHAEVALVALGGLGRRELSPRADLDLLLLHRGGAGVGAVADAVWYPVWDAGLGLDHAVRTVPEALAAAAGDLKVALGLLDARHVAGDAALTGQLRRRALDGWRRRAGTGLPELVELTRRRWERQGELAFLLEGDLKESRGGLRDVTVLRAVALCGIADAIRPAVRAAHVRLLDVRDAVHEVTGRRGDRLRAQDRVDVAAVLGLAEPAGADAAGGVADRPGEYPAGSGVAGYPGDALLRRVAQDARTVAYAMDDAFRAVRRWTTAAGSGRAGPPVVGPRGDRRPLAPDVVEQDGEVVLARSAVGPRPDPGLALRVAAAAARADLPIARSTLEWLATFAPALPRPWPAPARAALVTLLGAGPALVPAWEACDRYGLVAAWLPEWARLRGLPQHNPVHRYTVDRHLVQTAAEAAAVAREVARPDLLLLGALLHDVGKGLSGEHAAAGAPVAVAVARRIGLPDADVDTIEALVRLHLLLPETATRRDVTDPRTLREVAGAVGDADRLDLLYGLARADAVAAGPGAWSRWKGGLVADLVAGVRELLSTGRAPRPAPPDPALLGPGDPVALVAAERVSVAADRAPHLLAAVAGTLARHRLDVLAAELSTMDGRTVVRCDVRPRYGEPPDATALRADLLRAARGEVPGSERLLRGAARRAAAAPRVSFGRSPTGLTVLELRAADAPALLYRVATALAAAGVRLAAARIATLGGDVVDTFDLADGCDGRREEVARAVLRAVRA